MGSIPNGSAPLSSMRSPDLHTMLLGRTGKAQVRGQTAGLDPLGTTRQAQCACSLGARRLAGLMPASASRRQFQRPAPHAGLSAIGRSQLCPGTLWPKGRVSRQGQPGRRSGQGQLASLRAGSPAGPGVDYPVASGRCGVLTRRGPVNRDAQWQDSDRFSRAVEPAGRSTAPNGPSSSPNDPVRSKQVPPGPCSATWRAGRVFPA
jgi:hypothetical protein